MNSICLAPDIYGKLAKLLCEYYVFWPCSKLISDYIEGNNNHQDEDKIRENVIHFLTDVHIALEKIERKACGKRLSGTEWVKTHRIISSVFEETEIIEDEVCPYNVMQVFQHIHYTWIELSRLMEKNIKEPAEIKYLRTEVFNSLCLVTLNNFVSAYRDAPWDDICGIQENS